MTGSALDHLAEVDEFVSAVGDPDYVAACFHHVGAERLAVWCAELVGILRTRVEGMDGEAAGLRGELMAVRAERNLFRRDAGQSAKRIRVLEARVRELNRLVWEDENGVVPAGMTVDEAMAVAVRSQERRSA